ncbi:U6 snRNA phosphodiesterase Usb1 [Zopfochytrium polystomum]|nr:U6 snRNA phosphodiesterase Usb1 [Zopfochytrium polystomum]
MRGAGALREKAAGSPQSSAPTSTRSDPSSRAKKVKKERGTGKLPAPVLPDGLRDRYKEKVEAKLHASSGHPVTFVPGNWSTVVFVAVRCSDEFSALVQEVLTEATRLVPSLTPVAPGGGGLHISLSRTIFLKAFHVDKFNDALKEGVVDCKRFSISFTRLSCYVNDDGTRSFLSFDVGAGHADLASALSRVDAAVKKLDQPTFYEDPKFHASVGWAPDKAALDDRIADELDVKFARRLSEFSFYVTEVVCRTMNRDFKFPLRA